MIAKTEKGPVPFLAEEHAFLASVIYASVFDYPLTIDQLHESLIGVHAAPGAVAAWHDASPALQAAVEFHDGYYFPRGRHDLLDLRQKREAISRGVLHDMRGPLRLVRRMPFVRMVAISGSLAHLNADGEADLDLFVITRGGRVWAVTTTVLLVSRLLGWRRRLCLNYVISDRQLTVEPRDLFTANQIVNLRPVCGDECYRRFLAANQFVQEFYPNFAPRPAATDGGAKAPPLRMNSDDTLRDSRAEAPPLQMNSGYTLRDGGAETPPPRMNSDDTLCDGGAEAPPLRTNWGFTPRSGGALAPPGRLGAAIRHTIEWLLDHTVAPLYERCCRAAYRWYLNRRAHTWQSREQVRLEPECLKLHTSSHRQTVMARFERALAEAERLTPAAARRAQAGR